MVLKMLSTAWRGFSLLFRIVSLVTTISAVAAGAYYLNGIQDVRVENVTNEGFSNVGLDGFDATLTADVTNPSRLDIPITYISYKVVLQDQSLLTEGTLQGMKIAAQEETHIEIVPRIFWRGSSSALAQYLLQDQVLADVHVTAQVIPALPTFSFVHTMDIKPALQEMQSKSTSGVVTTTIPLTTTTLKLPI